MSAKGLLIPKAVSLPYLQNLRDLGDTRLLTVLGFPPAKAVEFCDSEPWLMHPSACGWGTASCLPRPGDG